MNRLEQIAEQINGVDKPPVHLWKPKHEGVIDIRIDAQGGWFHEGGAITRDKLVNLFASILWAEGDAHFLVTPAEKLAIKVEDVPYVIHQAEQVEGAWVVVTNTHEQMIIGEAHPVELRLYQEQWVPYVKVRYDLWARVNRSIFYQWVDTALGNQSAAESLLTLTSLDYCFEVARS